MVYKVNDKVNQPVTYRGYQIQFVFIYAIILVVTVFSGISMSKSIGGGLTALIILSVLGSSYVLLNFLDKYSRGGKFEKIIFYLGFTSKIKSQKINIKR